MSYAQQLTDWCLRVGINPDTLIEGYWDSLVKGQELQDKVEAGIPCKTVLEPKASINRLEASLSDLFDLIENMIQIRGEDQVIAGSL